MPTTFSTALPANATITRPVKAGEIPRNVVAGVSAPTNQSETNAEPMPAPTSITIASHMGHDSAQGNTCLLRLSTSHKLLLFYTFYQCRHEKTNVLKKEQRCRLS